MTSIGGQPLKETEAVDTAARRGIRSSLLGMVVNLALSAAKCLLPEGHSFALIADGIESLSDVVSSSVAAIGIWLFVRRNDDDQE